MPFPRMSQSREHVADDACLENWLNRACSLIEERSNKGIGVR